MRTLAQPAGAEAVPWYDTAGSAKELAAHPEPGVAVIASSLAAQTYGLEVLASGIEDLAWNYTRFFVMAGARRRSRQSQDLAGFRRDP